MKGTLTGIKHIVGSGYLWQTRLRTDSEKRVMSSFGTCPYFLISFFITCMDYLSN